MKKICLVGCGNIGRLHAHNLAGKADLSFYSRRRESAEEFSRRFGGGRVFGEYGEVLDSQVDALVLCSPPEAHCRQAIQALEAGKAVLVEKPLCVSPEEIQGIGRTLEAQGGALLMVAENYYYKPSVKLIRWLMDRGFIGQVQKVYVQKRFAQAATGWKSECGTLLEGGIHFVALISALLDAAPTRVQAQFPGKKPQEPERSSVVRLEYEGGVAAELHYAWNAFSLTRGTFQHSRVWGTEGRITFESNGLYVRLKSRQRRRLYFPGLKDLMGYQAMARDFLQCLEERGRKPHSDFDKARRDLQIVFAAYTL